MVKEHALLTFMPKEGHFIVSGRHLLSILTQNAEVKRNQRTFKLGNFTAAVMSRNAGVTLLVLGCKPGCREI